MFITSYPWTLLFKSTVCHYAWMALSFSTLNVIEVYIRTCCDVRSNILLLYWMVWNVGTGSAALLAAEMDRKLGGAPVEVSSPHTLWEWLWLWLGVIESSASIPLFLPYDLSVYTTFFLLLFLFHYFSLLRSLSHSLTIHLSLTPYLNLPHLLSLSPFLSLSLSLCVYRSAWLKARSLNISSSSSRAKLSYTKAAMQAHLITPMTLTGTPS